MFRKKGFWIGLIILLVLAGGGGYAYYNYVYLPDQEVVEETIATAQVEQGDLVLSVSGSGTLSPASEVALGFETGGYVDVVLVGVGDRVVEGDVLARLETVDLELAVAEAEIRAREAQLDLAETTEGATDAELADAEAAVRNAKLNLAVAQYTYNSAQNSDLDAAVRAAQIQYEWSVDQYWTIEARFNSGTTSDGHLEDAWNDQAVAEADLNEALREAQMEQLDAWNGVDQAQNRVYQAEEKLASLQSGPAEDTVLRAELQADQAAMALEEARDNLAAAELRAPFDGTVVEVTAIPGEYVGTASILTLADLEEPLLEFWVEESDMSGVAVGNRVEIIFEALPDDVFTGEILRVEPALVTVGNTLAVQAWASVDLASHSVNLLGGMNAEIEVISAESRDTLLVPVEALRELGPDQYAVFVVQPDGEMEMRLVEVGLKDFVNAEILSGLEVGEVVSLGVEESTEASTTSDEEQMPGMPGFFGPLEGGGPGGPPGGP
jgi:HlyD family secretion protein